jgi:hypothetical protein
MIFCATVVALVLSLSLPAGAAGTKIRDSTYGFSFTLPKSWIRIPLNGGDISGILASATKNDPSLKDVLSRQVRAAVKDGIKVFVFGPAHDGFFSNVSVYVTSSKGQLSGTPFLHSTDAQVKVAYAEAGFKDVATSITRLSMGQVLIATYRISKVSPAYIEQIYVEHKTHVDIVTLTTTSLTQDQALLQMVDHSWSWL